MNGDPATGFDSLGKQHVAGTEEVRVGNVQRRGDEAAGIDQAALADQNTVFVDQVDLAVGFQRAVNLGNVAARHPVEDGRAIADLVDGGGFARADRERVPIDHRPHRVVLDDHVIGAGARDGHIARNHRRIERIAQGRRGRSERSCRNRSKQSIAQFAIEEHPEPPRLDD